MNTYTYDNTGIHMADKDGTVISYIKDYHGSIVGTASSSGKFLQEYNEVVYEAFGNLWDGETPDNFGYCGEYRDDESGLIYLRNRYYDSRSGRFITEDPAQDGLNWYVYAANNPISFVDPWGLEIKLDDQYADELIKIMQNAGGKVNRVKLNDDNTVSMSDDFSLSDASYGEKLINDLINCGETITITVGKDNGAYFDSNKIILTENEKLLTTLSTDGTAEQTYTTPWLRMAHELIHFWDITNSININGTGLYTYIGEGGNEITVMNDPKVELIATGINYSYSPKGVNQIDGDYSGYVNADLTGYITENIIRAENGLPERVSYNNIDTVITYSGSIMITNFTDGTEARKYFFN